jgi:hypothetical protein
MRAPAGLGTRMLPRPPLSPAATETTSVIDHKTKLDVELKWLPPTVCHLMSVVPNPVHETVVAVRVGRDRLARSRIDIEVTECLSQRIS